MTLKKAFPFLSLILFSALAVPFAFLVLCNMDVDPHGWIVPALLNKTTEGGN